MSKRAQLPAIFSESERVAFETVLSRYPVDWEPFIRVCLQNSEGFCFLMETLTDSVKHDQWEALSAFHRVYHTMPIITLDSDFVIARVVNLVEGLLAASADREDEAKRLYDALSKLISIIVSTVPDLSERSNFSIKKLCKKVIFFIENSNFIYDVCEDPAHISELIWSFFTSDRLMSHVTQFIKLGFIINPHRQHASVVQRALKTGHAGDVIELISTGFYEQFFELSNLEEFAFSTPLEDCLQAVEEMDVGQIVSMVIALGVLPRAIEFEQEHGTALDMKQHYDDPIRCCLIVMFCTSGQHYGGKQMLTECVIELLMNKQFALLTILLRLSPKHFPREELPHWIEKLCESGFVLDRTFIWALLSTIYSAFFLKNTTLDAYSFGAWHDVSLDRHAGANLLHQVFSALTDKAALFSALIAMEDDAQLPHHSDIACQLLQVENSHLKPSIVKPNHFFEAIRLSLGSVVLGVARLLDYQDVGPWSPTQLNIEDFHSLSLSLYPENRKFPQLLSRYLFLTNFYRVYTDLYASCSSGISTNQHSRLAHFGSFLQALSGSRSLDETALIRHREDVTSRFPVSFFGGVDDYAEAIAYQIDCFSRSIEGENISYVSESAQCFIEYLRNLPSGVDDGPTSSNPVSRAIVRGVCSAQNTLVDLLSQKDLGDACEVAITLWCNTAFMDRSASKISQRRALFSASVGDTHQEQLLHFLEGNSGSSNKNSFKRYLVEGLLMVSAGTDGAPAADDLVDSLIQRLRNYIEENRLRASAAALPYSGFLGGGYLSDPDTPDTVVLNAENAAVSVSAS